jgi:hypothetical protein
MKDSIESLKAKTGLLIKSVEWIYLHVTGMISGDVSGSEAGPDFSRHFEELEVKSARCREVLVEIMQRGGGKTDECVVLYEFLGELWSMGRFCAGVRESIEIYHCEGIQAEGMRRVFLLSDEVELLFSRMEDAFLGRDRRLIMELIDSAGIVKQRYNLMLLDVAREMSDDGSSFHIAAVSEYFKRVLDYVGHMLEILMPCNSHEQK